VKKRRALKIKTAPKEHQKPLPWQRPKPQQDEPDTQERVAAIMSNPNYIQADSDSAFLRQDAVRGVRLQVDYLKAELLLEEHGIEHTVVVYGSTRIVEASEAQRKINALEESLMESETKSLKKELKIAKRILQKSHFYDEARKFGQIVGRSGKGSDDTTITLMTGGGPGIMEAANRGAFDVGAKSIGLNITLPHEQYPNPYVTPELCFQFHYFAMRKLHFLRRARALVVFPGGYGTFDECFEVLTLVQTRKIEPLPIIFVGQEYWESIVNFKTLVKEGVIDPEDLEIFRFAESAKEAWEIIMAWHKANNSDFVTAV